MAKNKRFTNKIINANMRVDLDFLTLIKKIPRERLKKGLEDDLIGSREITRMMKNVPEFDIVLDKLKNNPRKKKNE